MKTTILKLAVPLIVVFAFITQCDSVDPGVGDTDTDTEEQLELLSPENSAKDQSINVELVWKQIRGARTYELMVSETENFESAVIDTVIEADSFDNASISFNATSLTRGTTYYWKVFPIKQRNSGPWSEVWSFTTRESEAEPGAVDLISPNDGINLEEGEIKFEWDAMEDVENYNYQVSADADFTELIVDTLVSSSSINVDDLEAGEYSWRVAPELEAGNGPWSSVWSFLVETGDGTDDSGDDGDDPDDGDNGDNGDDSGDSGDDDSDDTTHPKVTLISPADGDTDLSTNLEFTWEEESGFNRYEYQLSDDPSFGFVLMEETVTGSSYSVEDLDYEKEYYWRVKVEGAHDEWSDVWSLSTESESYTAPPSSGDFVTTQNSNFVLNGETYRFAGTNAYYLPNYEKINSGVVDRAFNLFEESGVTVLRMWGFYDGYDCGYSRHDSNENVIQTAPGEYSESALRDLDRVIAKGKERGIKFIIPFVNYWDELGGICQYNTWAGASNPSRNMEFFMNNSETQKWFKDYIDMLLNRVNTVTGVKYKDEPAIFAWQIMNEGRNSNGNPAVLRDWYQEIAQYIKSIDSNHLVGTGEEGFDDGTPSEYTVEDYSNTYVLRAQLGTSYIQNTAIPEIDFGSAHWYPNEWGFGQNVTDDMLTAQRAWLVDHQRIADNHDKPFIIGEFGFPAWANDNVHAMYDDLYEQVEDLKVDGNLLWQLVADGEKCWEFGGNICYPGGREDTELYNKFKQHIDNMRGLK